MEIKKAEIVCNAWTNNYCELFLTVDKYKKPETEEKIMLEDEESIFVYRETLDGFVTYGLISKIKRFGHGSGYRWSSRGSVFNGMFGKQIIDNITLKEESTGYKYSASMTVESVLPLLPSGYYILEQVETNNYGKIEEISYLITNKEHEKLNQYNFKDIQYKEGGKRYIRNRIFL